MSYAHAVGGVTWRFDDLKDLLAKASPLRSGDVLAGIAAATAEQRMAARMALAELPLARFLDEVVIPYEEDEVTRLILDGHDAAAFAPVAHLTVGDFRDWLLCDETDAAALAPGLMPEMAAAVSKLMRNQDLVLVAKKCRVTTRFRDTIGLPGRLAVRIQPNHPTDDAKGIAASILDGLLYGCGDAVIGINPAGDGLPAFMSLWRMLDEIIQRFGIDLALLAEAREAALSLRRGTVGDSVMYFETGQGSALSAGAHGGVDQQTLEARAYGVARRYRPLLANSVVGFIGPEYLYDGKQIIRAGLEDHCCGKLLGVDVCYTNHAEADQDDMDTLLTLLGTSRRDLHHGRSGRGRRDAQLPEHLVPRCALPAQRPRLEARGDSQRDLSCAADGAACQAGSTRPRRRMADQG